MFDNGLGVGKTGVRVREKRWDSSGVESGQTRAGSREVFTGILYYCMYVFSMNGRDSDDGTHGSISHRWR